MFQSRHLVKNGDLLAVRSFTSHAWVDKQLVISENIRLDVALELLEDRGMYAFDDAWRIADAMLVAGSMAGYRTWCSIAGKVAALHMKLK